jgi:demethylmenaquinone methyltransferase/2-methoxy-6-polyprenyl-1,4-benzoquinol methylase/phosphoethanolamine N-methyltransferase
MLLSFGRAPAIRRKTVELAGIREGELVLDVGCGTGTLTVAAKRVAGAGGVDGIDASPEMIEVAREKAAKKGLEVDFQVGLIEQLPFGDDHFDVVLSSLMLHHLPDDLKRKGFAEVYRVLKPGGRFLAVDLSGRAGLIGHIMALFGHGLDESYIERLKAMAQEAGLVGVESGRVDVGLAYVKGIARNE